MESKKVILIGLDGATWDLLESWIKNNKLPTMRKLVEKSCCGILESTIPHVTPPAWTSIATGKNPAKHGIFDFTSIKKKNEKWDLNLYTSRDKQAKEMWDYLTGKSIVINVPLTYPPRTINGTMVTGMYTPSKNSEFIRPKEFKKTILELCPGYEVELRWAEYKDKKQNFLMDLHRMTEERIKLFWYFFEQDWNFYFFVFVGTDRIQHILWDESELLRYYQHLDDFLGKLIDCIRNNASLLLVSDHGFSKIKKMVHINSFLQQESYLKAKMSSYSNSNNILRKLGLTKENLNEMLLKYKLANFYNKLPPKVLHIIRKIVPGQSNPVYDFDIKNSKAIMVGTGSIYINKECSNVEEEIIRKLENLKAPDTGEKVIKKVFRKEEIYSGSLLKKAPDLLILPNKGYSVVSSGLDEVFESPEYKKADHALDGIFLAYGPDIRQGIKLQDTQVYDITPTILHMFGMPVPDDMDGRVLKEIFKENSEPARRKVKYQKVGREREKVREKIGRLRESGKI